MDRELTRKRSCETDRAQRGGERSAVRRFCIGSRVAALVGGHQRHQYRGPQRVLQRAVPRPGQFARHAQQRERRRHWVRWVRCFPVDAHDYMQRTE